MEISCGVTVEKTTDGVDNFKEKLDERYFKEVVRSYKKIINSGELENMLTNKDRKSYHHIHRTNSNNKY